jgi:Glycosyl transferase family 2
MACRPSRGRVALAAIARWETQYAPEWLAYHRAIGFDHVYLICNDDDPAPLWEAVLPFAAGAEPFVTFTHFPWHGQRFHMLIEALRQARAPLGDDPGSR